MNRLEDIAHECYELEVFGDGEANYLQQLNQEQMATKDKVQFPDGDDPTLPARTRIVGMKWVKLGEGKDPEWGKRVFLCINDKDDPRYDVGLLRKIEDHGDHKKYYFESEINTEREDIIFTHYAVPTIPVD